MRQLNFVVSGPKINKFLSSNMKKTVTPITPSSTLVNILVCSGYIHDHNLKLGKTALNFGCFCPFRHHNAFPQQQRLAHNNDGSNIRSKQLTAWLALRAISAADQSFPKIPGFTDMPTGAYSRVDK